MPFGPCREHEPKAKPGSCRVCRRIEVEGKIARRIVRDMLAAGYSVSVHDSCEVTVRKSRDEAEIMAALFTADDDRLYAHGQDGAVIGWVWLVYGNSGWDVVCDYSTSLDELMRPVLDYAETLDGAA